MGGLCFPTYFVVALWITPIKVAPWNWEVGYVSRLIKFMFPESRLLEERPEIEGVC